MPPKSRGLSSNRMAIDTWLALQALQNKQKHLSITRVLIDEKGHIAGYYTLATGQVDFADLPGEVARNLPRRALPIALVAWLGVDERFKGRGLGTRLFASALSDCHNAGRTFPFVAVVIDCIDLEAKFFYQRWDFKEIPGRPMRLFLATKTLEALMGKQ